MANQDQSAFLTPDYETIRTDDECDEFILYHRDRLVGKDLIERQIKATKKEYVSALNEQLKELAEEREHEMGVLLALDEVKRRLHASPTNVIPMPPPPQHGAAH